LATRHVSRPWSDGAWISPFYPFSRAMESRYQGQPAGFWASLLLSHLLGWLGLALASWALPYLWQERPVGQEPARVLNRWLRQGGHTAPRRAKRPAQLLSLNPVLWLIGNGPAPRRALWAIVGVWGLVMLGAGTQHASDPMWTYGRAKPFAFLLKLL